MMVQKKEPVSLRRMLELEQELEELKREQGVEMPQPGWVKAGDWIVDHVREPQRIEYKKYLMLALTCGWFCGAHRFYSGHTIQGVLYLLLSWTGVSFAMTVVDVMILYLKCRPDEEGMVYL